MGKKEKRSQKSMVNTLASWCPRAMMTGYIVIAVAYLYLRFHLFHNPVEENITIWTLSESLITLPSLVLKYISILIAPISLSADYAITPVQSLLSIKFVIPFIVIVLLIMLPLIFNFQSSIFNLQLVFGILFFFLTLLPVYNIIPIVNPFAERYLYLPIVGFIIIIGSLLSATAQAGIAPPFGKLRASSGQAQGKFRASSGQALAYCSLLIIISIYSLFVIQRNKIWTDEYSLWSDTAIKTPVSYKAHNGLGNEYNRQGRLNEAIRELELALSLKTDYADAHNNLGVVYWKQGYFDEAAKEYRMVLSLEPHYPEAHNNLGIYYVKRGQFDEAINEYRMAIKLKPDYANAHNNLGLVYLKGGQIDEAIKEYELALSLNPDYANAHNNLGIAYATGGRWQEAIHEWEIALSINPNHEGARKNLEKIRQMMEAVGKE